MTYCGKSQDRPGSWLDSTINSATVVMTAALPSSSSSALRRLGSGGVTATTGCGWVVMRLSGSLSPVLAVRGEVRSQSRVSGQAWSATAPAPVWCPATGEWWSASAR
jgi:hypothetical protein